MRKILLMLFLAVSYQIFSIGHPDFENAVDLNHYVSQQFEYYKVKEVSAFVGEQSSYFKVIIADGWFGTIKCENGIKTVTFYSKKGVYIPVNPMEWIPNRG